MAIRIAAIAIGALLLGNSCGPTAPAPRTPDPLAGTYVLRGGGGALDAVTALASAFSTIHPSVQFQGFEDVGSDAAVKLTASGEADLGFISRELRPGEVSQVLTVSIGRSGTALAVNASNLLQGLTKDQVAQIYTGAITDWNDVGGNAGRIRPFLRESGSAVRSTFEAYFFGGTKPVYGKIVADVNDANETLKAISSFNGAVGMLSMTAQVYGAQGIRLLAIDGISATRANVANGTYRVLRPLYLVYNPDPSKVKPAMKEFLDFVRGPAGRDVLAGL